MTRRFFSLLALALVICLLVLPLLTGCGGSHSSSLSNDQSSTPVTSKAVGQAMLTIRWPSALASAPSLAKPRLVPAASNSITVTLKGPSTLSPQTLTRPAQGQSLTATASFTNLIVGSYTVTAVAHPNVDGTGTAQAQASAPLTVSAGQTAPLSLTLGSTIVSVVVTPSPVQIEVGQTSQLMATAYDGPTGTGNVVLTSAFAWTSSISAVASVDPATGLVTGVAVTRNDPPTPVQITATDPESGVSGVSAVTVLPAAAPITGVVQDAANQSAISGATVTISRAGVVVDTEIAGQNNREARFTSIALPAGVYTLTASAPNYGTGSVTATLSPITLSPGQDLDIGIIPLTSTVGRILGRVTAAATGAGIGSATVTLTPTAGGTVLVLTTAADGSFNDGLVPVGSYGVTASAAGYVTSASQPVSISSNDAQPTTVNIALSVPVTSPIR